jgi:hypothetical protein
MNYKSIKNQPEHSENPFVEKAIEDIKIVKKTQVVRSKDRGEIQMIVSDGGEIQGYSQFLRFVEVDESQFAKVYLSQFTSFWELSKPAIRVFGYILTVLKPKEDKFYFEMDECLAYTKYTHSNNVLTGLSNLIECGIIARSTKHYIYYINPLVVFNGDRVSFTKTYIKKKQVSNPNQLDIFNTVAKELI